MSTRSFPDLPDESVRDALLAALLSSSDRPVVLVDAQLAVVYANSAEPDPELVASGSRSLAAGLREAAKKALDDRQPARVETAGFVLELRPIAEARLLVLATPRPLGGLRDAEFLATVSHELRTPLNAILGWAHVLRKRSYPDESYRRGLDVITRNAKAQAQIVEDLLDVSRIATGKLLLERVPADVGESLRAAAQLLRPVAEARGVTLDVRVADGEVMVEGDPERLRQIAWNLLSNAIKYSTRGGNVVAEVTRDASEVVLAVRDHGVGIDLARVPHLFDHLQRAGHASAARDEGGLGLGLPIVRRLAELHGGTVRAESAGLGQGSVFSLVLPIRDAPAVSEERFPESMPLSGVRILVVDDEPDARELIALLLEEQGADVAAAASAGEAMASLLARPVDVLLSDIGMPGEDGYALIRRVRAHENAELARVPALALTAYARADDARKAFLAGYQMHVPKPAEPSTLVGVIRHLAGKQLP